MYDCFLQREVDLEEPDCGGIFSQGGFPESKEDILFHFGNSEIKNSSSISIEIISSFALLAEDSESFFSLCTDPEKLNRNSLERFIQEDLERISKKDPLVHMKEAVARPILDLKEEEIKLPTSRVKKFASKALEFLASHSEDWRNRTFVGVHPQRLQALVRDDKWDTYENRLLYTLSKILNTLINQRLRELKSVNDAYGEIQKYYEVTERSNYQAVLKETNALLAENYSSEAVEDNRRLLKSTIDFLKRLQLSMGSFWNSALFNHLKKIPNVEVDINRFILTNVLMNNQHYLFLPKIQQQVLKFRSKELSRQEKLKAQIKLQSNEILVLKRYFQDFITNYQSYAKILNLQLQETIIGLDIKSVNNKCLRFVCATSKPSNNYEEKIKEQQSDINTISILIYPQEKPYLNEDLDSFSTLLNLFGDLSPKWGKYLSIGISPQSFFSKQIIQRILFIWIWSILMAKYPYKISNSKFINVLLPKDIYTDGCIFKQYNIDQFKAKVNSKEHEDRIKKNELQTYHKRRDDEAQILEKANALITIIQKCPCCGSTGVLQESPTAQNFMFNCSNSNCNCRWSRNHQKIKWITPTENKLFGKFEDFEMNI